MAQINEDSFRKLKRDVDSAKADADRAKGALDQLMKQLQSEFDCEDLKEAKALLEDLSVKMEKAQRKFEEAFKEYEKKWRSE